MINELTTHLWQSTLFALAAGLLTLAFRKNRAKVRFWLWLSASLKFFVPFALLIGAGSRLGWAPVAEKIATPAVSFAVETIAEPFSYTVAPTPIAPHSADWAPFVVLGVWACGFLTILLFRLRLWLGIRAAIRSSEPLDIPAPVEVRSTTGLLEPGVVGVLHPKMLLPEGILERLSPQELEAVVAHELCHVRRRDNLYAAVHMIVEAVFWFHPLVWWIGARLVEERERACDEDVLSLGNQPRIYADAILSVCKLYVESPLVCVSGVTGSDIRSRIEAIMKNRMGQNLNSAKKMLLAGAGIAAVAVPVMIGVVIGIGHMPLIHAQSPVAIPVVAPIAQIAQVQAKPAAPAASAAPASQVTLAEPIIISREPIVVNRDPIIRYQDRRLVVMLFDIGSMTADEQSRVQKSAIDFVESQLKPADLVCVMEADSALIRVKQDFTADPAALKTAIQSLKIGNNSPGGIESRLANIEMAAKMLAGFPEKKALIYFSAKITQSGADNQAQLISVINAAKNANVAVYPVDASTGTIPAAGITGPAATQQSLPPGVSQDEYSRRVAEAKQKFDSNSAAMSRVYIRYGAPDQIDSTNGQTSSQIWRYNYLDNFHSSVEFAFTRGLNGTGIWRININYPGPLATFTGVPIADNAPADGLSFEGGRGPQTMPAKIVDGLPVRRSSMGVYPAGELSKLFVPLDSLSGNVDVLAQVRTRAVAGADAKVSAVLRDSVTLNGTSQQGMYDSGFTLNAGSYECRVLVRESASGRVFREIISFDVR